MPCDDPRELGARQNQRIKTRLNFPLPEPGALRSLRFHVFESYDLKSADR
jgi:hypothetical protein